MKFKKYKKHHRNNSQKILFTVISCVFVISTTLFVLKQTSTPKTIIVSSDKPAFSFYSRSSVANFIDTLNFEIDSLDNDLESSPSSFYFASYSLESPALEERINSLNDFNESFILLDSSAQTATELKKSKQIATLDSNYFHMKVFTFDQKRTIISSANPTTLQASFDYADYLLIENGDLTKDINQHLRKIYLDNYQGTFDKQYNYNSSTYFRVVLQGPQNSSELRNSLEQAIINAQDTIQIMIWQITDQRITKLLNDADSRGVKIEIITDDFTVGQKNSTISELNEGIAVTLDTKELARSNPQASGTLNRFFHYHTIIVDNKILINGSNNWTQRGLDQNYESAFITNDSGVIGSYKEDFDHYLDEFSN